MKFGGFQPFTLSDYPGRAAAIVFAQGCNFRCPFCHNGPLLPMMVQEECLVPEETVLEHLKRRRGRLEGLVVSGGEPTLQAALPGFLRRVKRLEYQVKLDTNGSRPEMLALLLRDGLVDFVAMDVKAPPEKYGLLCGGMAPMAEVGESMTLLVRSGVPHLFRTTVVPGLLGDYDLAVLAGIIPKDSPHILQEFNSEHALDPAACLTAQIA